MTQSFKVANHPTTGGTLVGTVEGYLKNLKPSDLKKSLAKTCLTREGRIAAASVCLGIGVWKKIQQMNANPPKTLNDYKNRLMTPGTKPQDPGDLPAGPQPPSPGIQDLEDLPRNRAIK